MRTGGSRGRTGGQSGLLSCQAGLLSWSGCPDPRVPACPTLAFLFSPEKSRQKAPSPAISRIRSLVSVSDGLARAAMRASEGACFARRAAFVPSFMQRHECGAACAGGLRQHIGNA